MIDVLILLWSLANSLADINLDHLPLGFHTSLLAMLDDGVAMDSLSHLVPSYTFDWWRHIREPDPRRILVIDTLDECLDCYRQYIPVMVTISTLTNSQPAHKPPGYRADC